MYFEMRTWKIEVRPRFRHELNLFGTQVLAKIM